MTCIAAVEGKNCVFLCSDSFLGLAEIKHRLDRPKFFCAKSGLVFAYAGSFRVPQIIENHCVFPARPRRELEHQYVVKYVVTEIRRAIAEGGAESEMKDSELLIIYRGKIYSMYSDYSVTRVACGYVSIGAGCQFALGALAAMSNPAQDSESALTAVRAAAQHCSTVSGPFHSKRVNFDGSTSEQRGSSQRSKSASSG